MSLCVGNVLGCCLLLHFIVVFLTSNSSGHIAEILEHVEVLLIVMIVVKQPRGGNH